MYFKEIKNYNTVLLIVGSFLFFIVFFNLYVIIEEENSIEIKKYQKLPRFWTNTGFCPLGDVSKYLIKKDIRVHFNLIGALPNSGLDTIRIHWLLDLIDVKFENESYNHPIYNFKKLDVIVKWANDAGLSIGFEFMGNPNNVFSNKSDSFKSFLWQDLSFQIAQRYLLQYGENKLMKWKFETWNEPDLKNYNLINFTENNFIQYAIALRKGLKSVNENFKLRGPAGLFKNKSKHVLCWSSLKFCNNNLGHCPFDILTFHHKGNGDSNQVASGGKTLLSEIFSEYKNLNNYPVSNDEADPIAGWSTPREFQSDINYAVDIVNIVLEHWSMKINSKEFINLESISHDNAFMSYHPYEFSQRTLFARFQMNNSIVPYSQFIAKPVYIALGMLGHLGDYALDSVFKKNISYLTTISETNEDYYLAIIATSTALNDSSNTEFSFTIQLPNRNKEMALCVEVLERNETNPIELWYLYRKPSYPDSYQREWMRRIQGPKVLETKLISTDEKKLKVNYTLRAPWVALIRICNVDNFYSSKPENIRFLKLTKGEILIFWELESYHNCVQTFEIKFKPSHNESALIENDIEKDKSWIFITRGWRVPFRYFQFKAKNDIIDGYYKVRAVHISGKSGPFSKIKKYVEE